MTYTVERFILASKFFRFSVDILMFFFLENYVLQSHWLYFIIKFLFEWVEEHQYLVDRACTWSNMLIECLKNISNTLFYA